MNEESEKKVDFSSDNEIKQMIDMRDAKRKALAYLRRGRAAQIPPEHMRVNREQFAELLDPDYIKQNSKGYKDVFGADYSANDPKSFSEYLYDNADKLLDTNYILIDGGNADARRRAGCALLFRLIVCDKWGLYKECSKLSHIFQTVNIQGTDPHRNDLSNELIKYGVVFIGEFYTQLMNVHFDTGTFFDEVFVARRYAHRPTIISYAEPIIEDNKIKHKDFGVTFADFSTQIKPSKKVLRIKVVPYGTK